MTSWIAPAADRLGVFDTQDVAALTIIRTGSQLPRGAGVFFERVPAVSQA
jgi:hypothetical protein